MNKKLKIAFVSKGVRQIKAAKDLKFDPAKLSKIINGWIKPSLEEKQALAEYLDSPIQKLFNKKNGV